MVTPTKIYRSRLANLLGLQVARIIVARSLLLTRRLFFQHEADQDTATLMRDGIVVIPNFLNQEDFLQVQREFKAATTQDVFITKRVLDTAGLMRISCTISSEKRRAFSRTVRCFLGSDRIERILSTYDARPSLHSVGSTFQLSFWRTERCAVDATSLEAADHTNTELHSDSFQSVVKFFYYIDDVEEEDGPHAYIPGSHRLTLWRLLFEYVNSILSMRESPRLPKAGLWSYGRAPVKQRYPANTLLVADTFGFHQAVLPESGRGRSIVYLQYRSPPFR
jgi:hypothetical protein